VGPTHGAHPLAAAERGRRGAGGTREVGCGLGWIVGRAGLGLLPCGGAGWAVSHASDAARGG